MFVRRLLIFGAHDGHYYNSMNGYDNYRDNDSKIMDEKMKWKFHAVDGKGRMEWRRIRGGKSCCCSTMTSGPPVSLAIQSDRWIVTTPQSPHDFPSLEMMSNRLPDFVIQETVQDSHRKSLLSL